MYVYTVVQLTIGGNRPFADVWEWAGQMGLGVSAVESWRHARLRGWTAEEAEEKGGQ